ncbi:MAG: hypothetical protein R3E77_02070 [Steroidobacteraceae bacterium]
MGGIAARASPEPNSLLIHWMIQACRDGSTSSSGRAPRRPAALPVSALDPELASQVLHPGTFDRIMRAARDGLAATRRRLLVFDPTPDEVYRQMKKASTRPRRATTPPLQKVNEYLEKNFPDFFADAKFHVGDDEYFLYTRFGQYLARTIENKRASREKINRGFTVLNKMAAVSRRHPNVRRILVSGPLEYIVDAPKARALARKQLTATAQSYLESLCE